MFPGTTSSESPFLAPSRFPGPCLAELARPSLAWEADRLCWCGGDGMRVRRERARRRVADGVGVVTVRRVVGIRG